MWIEAEPENPLREAWAYSTHEEAQEPEYTDSRRSLPPSGLETIRVSLPSWTVAQSDV
jgi:hypothetical protein